MPSIKVGLHDLGGAEYMLRNGLKGVALDHVCVREQPVALDYSRFNCPLSRRPWSPRCAPRRA
jgi:hypothetical protein